MLLGFDTTDEHKAFAALMVYAVYRSRDKARYKVTPDLWGQIERFVKDAAKRAITCDDFLERLKPRLACATIAPRWLAVPGRGRVNEYGEIRFDGPGGPRTFAVDLLDQAPHRAIIATLYGRTAAVILLVRDRIEREKPIERDLERDAPEDVA